MAKPPAPPRRPGAEPRGKLASLSENDRRSVEQLAQVEGAIAALEGRDADMALDTALARRDQERVRKELETKASEAHRNAAAASRRQLVVRIGVGLGVLAGLGVLGWVGLLVRDRLAASAAVDAAATRAAAPFREAGFQLVETRRDAPFVLEGDRGRCFVAVAASTTGSHPVHIARGGEKTSGAGSVAWCSCAPTRTTVTAEGPPGTTLTVLARPAGEVGGADGLGRVRPAPAAILPETEDRPCVEEAIDALVKDGTVPPAPPTLPEAATRLASLGFTSVAGAPAEATFVPLPGDDATCFVAAAVTAGVPLTLRLPGGARTTGSTGVVAVCQNEADGASVWGDGKTAVAVVSAPLAGVGGTVGLREALARAGHPDAPIARTSDVLAADAQAIVLSSGASPSHIGAPSASLLGLAEPPYLFAFSVADGAGPPALGPAGAVVCSPALASRPSSALCLGGAGVFDGKDGVQAQRPEWLRIGTDPASLERALALMKLARRLALSEFEMTTVGSFTETARGVEVVGRAGETEVVGVVLGGQPPAIHTLSDGAPWQLEGEPRVVPLEPGARVPLTATPPLAPLPPAAPGAAKNRRVVVFFRR